jgi:glucose dehydrogenase
MAGRITVILLAIAMALAGGVLAAGGAMLITAGGSWYYLPAGAALVAVAAGLAWRRRFALPLFGALLAATLAWSLWEAGLDGWALVPRLVAPAVLGAILTLRFVRRGGGQGSGWWAGAPTVAIAATLLAAGFASDSPGPKGATPLAAAGAADSEWRHWGRTLDGNRFSPLAEIDTGNVGRLELAWEYKSDVAPYAYHSFEATPLAAEGRLFLCLDRSVVVALDQASGREVWRFDAKPKLDGVFAATCRGVAYFEAPPGTADWTAAPASLAPCSVPAAR